jgi:hypothetical protein
MNQKKLSKLFRKIQSYSELFKAIQKYFKISKQPSTKIVTKRLQKLLRKILFKKWKRSFERYQNILDSETTSRWGSYS